MNDKLNNSTIIALFLSFLQKGIMFEIRIDDKEDAEKEEVERQKEGEDEEKVSNGR